MRHDQETTASASSTERTEQGSDFSFNKAAHHFGGSDFVHQPGNQANQNSPGVRKSQCDCVGATSDLFFFEDFTCNSLPRKSIEETACATLDTDDAGCQRSVIGIKTLENLNQHIPAPLKILTRDVNNRFRSVYDTSEPSKVALIRCGLGLGHKGCFLNPAIFENGFGVTAPLLLSLPFMLKSKSRPITLVG